MRILNMLKLNSYRADRADHKTAVIKNPVCVCINAKEFNGMIKTVKEKTINEINEYFDIVIDSKNEKASNQITLKNIKKIIENIEKNSNIVIAPKNEQKGMNESNKTTLINMKKIIENIEKPTDSSVASVASQATSSVAPASYVDQSLDSTFYEDTQRSNPNLNRNLLRVHWLDKSESSLKDSSNPNDIISINGSIDFIPQNISFHSSNSSSDLSILSINTKDLSILSINTKYEF
jgi:hypothetical protein